MLNLPKFFLFVVLAAITSAASSDEGSNKQEVPCWLDESYWNRDDYEPLKTTQLAMLKTLLLPINLDSPTSDAATRHAHGDFRFIAIGGFGVEVPGVDKFREEQLICRYGTRFIEGTTDAVEDSDHAELMAEFEQYARTYNLEMRRLLD